MKTLQSLVRGSCLLAVSVAVLSSIGCADHERVVVRHPAVVQERVVVEQPRAVVVEPARTVVVEQPRAVVVVHP